MTGIGFNTRNYLSNETANRYTRASEEVSSGRRSLRGSAAEFAIANQLRKDISGLGQATQNLRQGSSALQVASGGLMQTSGILTRLKELSVQANNDMLGNAGQGAIRAEFNELVSSLDSISGGTRFGGRQLFAQDEGNSGETSGTVVTARNRTESATGLTATPNGFTGDLDTSRSAGFVNERISGDLNVQFQDSGNGRQVQININGEDYVADLNDVRAGGTLEFRSTNTPENRIGLELDANDVSGLRTESGLRNALNTALNGAELNIGVSANVAGAGADPAFSANTLLNLDGSSGLVSGEVQDVRVNGTNGDYTVEVDIGGQTFRGSAQTVTDGGSIELSDISNPENRVSFDFSNDTSSITDAASFDAALTNALQPGGVGADVQIGDAARANGLTQTPSIEGFNAAQSTGFIDGVVRNVQVERNGGSYDMSLTLDNGQTFEAKGVVPQADGQIRLTNTKDSSARITLDLGADVSGLSSESGLQSELDKALGTGGTGAPVRFTSGNGFNDGTNGFEAGVNASITANGGTAGGRYAFSYDAATQTATVTNGNEVYTTQARGDGAQHLSFGNGVSVDLGDEFDASQSIGSQTFDVEQNGPNTLSFQGGSDPGSEFDINLSDISAEGLGLVGLDPSSPKAQAAIGRALDIVNGQLASIGAQQSAFETTMNSNIDQEIAQQEALATFQDTDFAQKLIDMTKEQVLLQTQASLTAQTMRLNQQQFQRLLGGM